MLPHFQALPWHCIGFNSSDPHNSLLRIRSHHGFHLTDMDTQARNMKQPVQEDKLMNAGNGTSIQTVWFQKSMPYGVLTPEYKNASLSEPPTTHELRVSVSCSSCEFWYPVTQP